jgi:folate-dependent tRNA-U54 methylase TrmFO/GidA
MSATAQVLQPAVKLGKRPQVGHDSREVYTGFEGYSESAIKGQLSRLTVTCRVESLEAAQLPSHHAALTD